MGVTMRWNPDSIRTVFCIAVVTTALAWGPAAALAAETQRAVCELEPGKSAIQFTLEAALHRVHGAFALKRGTLVVDLDTGKAQGLIVVDAASGDSGNRSRDQQMKASVLEVQKFPDITFSPLHVDGHPVRDGAFEARVTGILQLHGTEHQVVLDTHGHLVGERLTVTFHLLIPYVEWGLKDPSILFFAVSKQVDVAVTAEGAVTWAAQ